MIQRTCVINVVGLSPNLIGDATPRLRAFAKATGGVRTLRPPLPAVTCSSQSTMLTGLAPSEHGIVGNGWHDRALGEVQFWKQSNQLVGGEKVWETARRIVPQFRCANAFWWYAMHATTDCMVTPRPQYRADGRKIPDCLTRPAELRDELQQKYGQFPLFKFWGPLADLTSTDWIARAAIDLLAPDRAECLAGQRNDLVLVYLPHLDYALVGGASSSEHLYDAPGVGAVDFYIDGADIHAVQAFCDKQWPYSLGYGAPRGFVHLGIRQGAPRVRWEY